MSNPTRVTGTITITPPLTWTEFKDSPLYQAGYGTSQVRLAVAERAIDTNAGQVIKRTATGLVASTDGSFNFDSLVGDVQAAVDAFPGRVFGGRLECSDDWGEYRVQVRDGRAVEVRPRIVWPDEA